MKQHNRGSLDSAGLKSCQQLVKDIKTDLKKVFRAELQVPNYTSKPNLTLPLSSTPILILNLDVHHDLDAI